MNISQDIISIDLNKSQRHAVAHLLNLLLADEFVLYTKTLNYHWNIKSTNFSALHTFFQNQYEQIFNIIDAIAERSQTLDYPALGTLQEFLATTRLKETAGQKTEQNMIDDLLQTHQHIICTLRVDVQRCIDEFSDAGTNNFLTDIMEQHEKMAWMLRSHLV